MFKPHRDNDGIDISWRKYGLVIALNTSLDYRGGDLIFPEIGVIARLPAGTGVIFDAGLLHGVTEVTSGRRLVLISFVY